MNIRLCGVLLLSTLFCALPVYPWNNDYQLTQSFQSREDHSSETTMRENTMNRSKRFLKFGLMDMIRHIINKERPKKPGEIKTKTILYHLKNKEISKAILEYVEDKNLKTTNFDKDKKTKVIIHGFQGSCALNWVDEIATALKIQGDYNIICFDWEVLTSMMNYGKAVENIQKAAAGLLKTLRRLIRILGLKPPDIHLIGFSLGSHVCGFVGKKLEGIGRITGLDPAGPLFKMSSMDKRLAPTDAKFVDVIHSDTIVAGFSGALGHVDFYPNGGNNQNGCYKVLADIWKSLSGMVTKKKPKEDFCNHYRAVKYFIESISRDRVFEAIPCETYDKFKKGYCMPAKKTFKMGFHVDRSAKGKMYLVTKETEPFSGYQYKVEVTTSKPVRSQYKEKDSSYSLKLKFTSSNGKHDSVEVTSVLGGHTVVIMVSPLKIEDFKLVDVTVLSFGGKETQNNDKWIIENVSVMNSEGKRKLNREKLELIPGTTMQFKLNNEVLGTEESFGVVPLNQLRRVTHNRRSHNK